MGAADGRNDLRNDHRGLVVEKESRRPVVPGPDSRGAGYDNRWY
jgi:hypothetical protein